MLACDVLSRFLSTEVILKELAGCFRPLYCVSEVSQEGRQGF